MFDGDERIDGDLFYLATQSWGFLDTTLNGLSMNRQSVDFASKLLLIYFAARIVGATSAGTMLLSQRLGREATIMARCQYDYFLKMLYYDTYPHESNKVVDLVDQGAYQFVLQKKAGFDMSDFSKEQWLHFTTLAKQATEPNFTDGVMKGLRDNNSFKIAASEGTNPFAIWFFKNIEASFRTHWNYGSSIVHASPVDIPNVIVPQADGSFAVNADSRMKAPNKTIADLSQRCFSAMGLIRLRFNLPFTDEHSAWAIEFQSVADRHKTEPTDVRSMHD